MTSEISINMPNADSINKKNVRQFITAYGIKPPHIEIKEHELIICPESPVHADCILQMLDENDIKYTHE